MSETFADFGPSISAFNSRLVVLLNRCQFPEHEWEIDREGDRYFVRVVCTANEWKGRKWRLSPHMTDGEVVQTVFKALMTFLEHEAREAFTFDGEPVFGPHQDIHELVRLSKAGKLLKERDRPIR